MTLTRNISHFSSQTNVRTTAEWSLLVMDGAQETHFKPTGCISDRRSEVLFTLHTRGKLQIFKSFKLDYGRYRPVGRKNLSAHLNLSLTRRSVLTMRASLFPAFVYSSRKRLSPLRLHVRRCFRTQTDLVRSAPDMRAATPPTRHAHLWCTCAGRV